MSGPVARRWACEPSRRAVSAAAPDPEHAIAKAQLDQLEDMRAAVESDTPIEHPTAPLPRIEQRDELLADLHAALQIAEIALDRARRLARRADLGPRIEWLDHVYEDVEDLRETTELPGA